MVLEERCQGNVCAQASFNQFREVESSVRTVEMFTIKITPRSRKPFFQHHLFKFSMLHKSFLSFLGLG
jgi:hypothetical protein